MVKRKTKAIAIVAKGSKRGSKPGERRGGRQKGTPNKKNAEKIAALEAGGVMPLDYMLDLLRQPVQIDADVRDRIAMQAMRFEAAKAAAPYCHPKLSNIEHTGKDGKDLILPPEIYIVGVAGRGK